MSLRLASSSKSRNNKMLNQVFILRQVYILIAKVIKLILDVRKDNPLVETIYSKKTKRGCWKGMYSTKHATTTLSKNKINSTF